MGELAVPLLGLPQQQLGVLQGDDRVDVRVHPLDVVEVGSHHLDAGHRPVPDCPGQLHGLQPHQLPRPRLGFGFGSGVGRRHAGSWFPFAVAHARACTRNRAPRTSGVGPIRPVRPLRGALNEADEVALGAGEPGHDQPLLTEQPARVSPPPTGQVRKSSRQQSRSNACRVSGYRLPSLAPVGAGTGWSAGGFSGHRLPSPAPGAAGTGQGGRHARPGGAWNGWCVGRPVGGCGRPGG